MTKSEKSQVKKEYELQNIIDKFNHAQNKRIENEKALKHLDKIKKEKEIENCYGCATQRYTCDHDYYAWEDLYEEDWK